MLRTEDLGDVPNGITLHDLVKMVKAEGWSTKDVQVLAVGGDGAYEEPELEVTRQWDDGMLPPIPPPWSLEPPTAVEMNDEMLDLPDDVMDMDPPRGVQGPSAPSRPAPGQVRPSLLRRALSWKDRAR